MFITIYKLYLQLIEYFNKLYYALYYEIFGKMEIVVINYNARLPKKAHSSDAGWDLYTPKDFTIEPKKQVLINTGIKITVPKNTYGRIAPRSGLANKNGIDVLGGVIDRGYTGEIKVILINHGNNTKIFKNGDRIAQLIITKIKPCKIKIISKLKITSRKGGIGSTGL